MISESNSEDILVSLRNVILARKLQTLAKHYKKEFQRKPVISLGAGYKTTVPMVTDKEILSILMGVKKLNRRGIGHGDVVEPTLSEPSRVVLGSVGSPLEGVVGADREREMNPHPAMGTTSSGVL